MLFKNLFLKAFSRASGFSTLSLESRVGSKHKQKVPTSRLEVGTWNFDLRGCHFNRFGHFNNIPNLELVKV